MTASGISVPSAREVAAWPKALTWWRTMPPAGERAVANGAAHAGGEAAQEAESGLGGEVADDLPGQPAMGGLGEAAVDDGGQPLPGLAGASLAALGDPPAAGR